MWCYAACSCSWYGEKRQTLREAEDDETAHLIEVAKRRG